MNYIRGVVRPSLDGGIALDVRNDLPITGRLDEINSPTMFGGQLWWNTPIDGLRLGAAGGFVPGFDYDTHGAGPRRADPSRRKERRYHPAILG